MNPTRPARSDDDSASSFADLNCRDLRPMPPRRALPPVESPSRPPPPLSTAEIVALLADNGPRVLTRIRPLIQRLAPRLRAEDILADLATRAFRCRSELARIPRNLRPGWFLSNAERAFLWALRAPRMTGGGRPSDTSQPFCLNSPEIA